MRKFNFSAGPAALPEAVLQKAQEEMLDYQGTGMSVMEMSHRSKEFVDMAAQAEADFRDLMNVGDNYHVLFLQGGASLQWAAIPLNLTATNQVVDYVDTGAWSQKAIKEANKYCSVNVVASSKESNYDRIPNVDGWRLSDNAKYLHICTNETIGGIQYKQLPNSSVPLVADMSSDILSRPIDINQFGLIYAGAQKNIGPAGLTVVVVRKDLCGQARADTPLTLDYAVQADADSMSNTPPTYAWYLAGLVFSWLQRQGGLAAIEAQNTVKASTLYNAISSSNFFSSPVQTQDRSVMNVTFTSPDAQLDKDFVTQATARGLVNLKGHRSVGGMRASIYNAVPQAAIDALVEFMHEFENERG
ncbi:MAG: 3-phosphoserine/phosphohydroxythreonine transaminase [Gammaproteobacteria bacterium]|nr:3-phosphoserine/phosphohydroxythreonine transaminase [Gammaproteobacteria bacterium]